MLLPFILFISKKVATSFNSSVSECLMISNLLTWLVHHGVKEAVVIVCATFLKVTFNKLEFMFVQIKNSSSFTIWNLSAIWFGRLLFQLSKTTYFTSSKLYKPYQTKVNKCVNCTIVPTVYLWVQTKIQAYIP